MLITVSWHRDHAPPTYLEVEYDPKAWEDHAAAYAAGQQADALALLPLLAAYRLVQLVKPAFGLTPP